MTRSAMMALLFAACTGVAAADDAAVKARYDAAKAAFAADSDRLRKEVAAHLDAREKRARDAEDKKAVDQVKADRTAFAEKGELPKSLPAAVKEQFAAARSKMEAAYKAAIGGYTKAGKDDEVAGVEKELAAFQAGKPAAAPSLEAGVVGKVWSNNKVELEFRRGGTFVINGKKVGTWAVLGGDRVISVIDDGQHYDVYVFNKEFTSFQENYLGQPRKDGVAIGKVVRDK